MSAPAEGASAVDARTRPEPGFHGLSREDLSLLNRIAFAGATLGRVEEARAISAVARRLVPDHACWAIAEYLCRMSEGRREAALDWLEAEGLTRARAWEQAAELLLAETAGAGDARRRQRLVATLSERPGGAELLAAHGQTPMRAEPEETLR